ncbi:MAG: uroporphyrinogen-III synthase [Alphaproteobacteria bacterium]|nr:uroporphyrinogen-III synthase [Alphaproteobacteria bacterium]
MKNILVTRLAPASRANAKIFYEPLFTVEQLVVERISEPISAAIVTSANACFALEESRIAKGTKIFTVGEKTAAKLRRTGFQNIILSPQNSAESLQDLIADEPGLILYFRGSTISFDFAKLFPNIRDVFVYKTHEIKNFSTYFQKIPYDEVLIFSKRSCEIFHQVITRNNLLEYFSNSQILCLSQKILERARELGFKKIGIFPND